MRLDFMKIMTPAASAEAIKTPINLAIGTSMKPSKKLQCRVSEIDTLRIGAEHQVHDLGHHDGETECRQQRSEKVAFDDTRNHQLVNHPADAPHHNKGNRDTEQSWKTVLNEPPGDVTASDDEVALSKVLDVHHAPHQRQAIGS